MKLIRKSIVCVAVLLSGNMLSSAFAQKAERKHVREGNELYKTEKYTEAEVAYRKSLDVNPRSIEG
ncbi:MAG: tetratricopeptide repeat protein, partial [Parabacteroides sp.]|nr:tetratricopeptide repeat protein [Parabacteroides sp.]